MTTSPAIVSPIGPESELLTSRRARGTSKPGLLRSPVATLALVFLGLVVLAGVFAEQLARPTQWGCRT